MTNKEYQELLSINTPIIDALHRAIRIAGENFDDELKAKYQKMLQDIYELERKCTDDVD